MIKLFFYFGIILGSLFPIINSKPELQKAKKDSEQIAAVNNYKTTTVKSNVICRLRHSELVSKSTKK